MTTTADTFPVDSYKDAAVHLRRPFTRAAVRFKVQATFPKQNPNRGLIVAYIDARLAVERLNHVCPHLWYDEYQPLDQGRLLCRLTVDGITRHDIGDGYQGKGLFSDALKRAAVKFGVGVSLYAIPQTFLNVSDQHLKALNNGSLVLTPAGEARCRDIYGTWLDTVGRQAFGDPLDHGDVEGSQGDAETADPVTEPAAEPIGPDEAVLLLEAVSDAGLTDTFAAAVEHVTSGTVTTIEPGDLARLDHTQAARLAAWVQRKTQELAHA